MMDCISVENMRLSDAQTIANWVPSLELMGRAAMGVYRAAEWRGRVAIVAGSGNNGGDGFVLVDGGATVIWINFEIVGKKLCARDE